MQDITNLKDFLKWLALQEQIEEEDKIPEHKRFAHRWTIFPYQDAIYIGIATGLKGKDVLKLFPEIAELPVSESDEELPADLQNLSFKPKIFYYGPFNQEAGNLI